ncbi:MAG TPA: response regulator [Planctomycetota bacterium]|nr:response regulator [Planctomycetota bacterium]
MRILLIDDSMVIRSMLRDTLLKEGYEITETSNGHDAIKAFKEQTHDFVLSDYEMPDLTGMETARELKKIRPDVGIILFTAKSPPVDGADPLRTETEELGVQLFYKNVGLPNLMKSIKESIAARKITSAPVAKPAAPAQITVLMVTDSLAPLAEARIHLSAKGISVALASNSPAISTWIKSNKISLIVMDNMVNKQSSFVILKEIRAMDKNIKVIMTVTAQEEQLAGAAMKMAQLSLTNFIVKPYAADNLYKMISEVCKNGAR